MLETIMDNTGKYVIKQIIIGESMTIMAIDENGQKWYALNTFYRNVLFYKDGISDRLKKTDAIKDMTLIGYTDFLIHIPVETWFIKEEKLKELISKMKIQKRRFYEIRCKGLYNACLYFGLKTNPRFAPKRMNVKPDLTKYSLYEKICLIEDKTITNLTVWKLCEKCQKYFPDNPRYYPLVKNETNICLKCKNKRFKIDNPFLAFLYENNCDKIVENLYFERFEEAGRELKKKIEEVGM